MNYRVPGTPGSPRYHKTLNMLKILFTDHTVLNLLDRMLGLLQQNLSTCQQTTQ